MGLSHRSCLVLGASSQLGECLIPRLLGANYKVHAVSRKTYVKNTTQQSIQWHAMDLQIANDWPVAVSLVIHLAPLYFLPALLKHATAPLRVIAISSTSIRTKQNSPSVAERLMAQRLLKAEEELHQLCRATGHNLTILRPTMLYGLERDATIGRMQKFVRCWGVLPIPAMRTGLRQPVHVDDIAQAVVQVVEVKSTFNKVYELGGRDCLDVHTLAKRIFTDNQKSIRLLYIPTWIMSITLRVMRRLRPELDWSPALLKRAALDQVVNNQPAIDDFQYSPRPFSGLFNSSELNKLN